MEATKIAGVFVHLEGREAKLVIWLQVNRFRYSYEVHCLCRGFDEIDVVRLLVKRLDEAFPDFLERLAAIDARLRSNPKRQMRRCFSKTRSELYPKKDRKFTEAHSEPYKGLWIANNVNAKTMEQMVEEMCHACRIKFLSVADLQF